MEIQQQRYRAQKFQHNVLYDKPGGGFPAYERGGDARRLA